MRLIASHGGQKNAITGPERVVETICESDGQGVSQPYVHLNITGITDAELVDGFNHSKVRLNYFKIGDHVRIRRWSAKTDGYSSWSIGRVVHPRLIENEDGTCRLSLLRSGLPTP